MKSCIYVFGILCKAQIERTERLTINPDPVFRKNWNYIRKDISEADKWEAGEMLSCHKAIRVFIDGTASPENNDFSKDNKKPFARPYGVAGFYIKKGDWYNHDSFDQAHVWPLTLDKNVTGYNPTSYVAELDALEKSVSFFLKDESLRSLEKEEGRNISIFTDCKLCISIIKNLMDIHQMTKGGNGDRSGNGKRKRTHEDDQYRDSKRARGINQRNIPQGQPHYHAGDTQPIHCPKFRAEKHGETNLEKIRRERKNSQNRTTHVERYRTNPSIYGYNGTNPHVITSLYNDKQFIEVLDWTIKCQLEAWNENESKILSVFETLKAHRILYYNIIEKLDKLLTKIGNLTIGIYFLNAHIWEGNKPRQTQRQMFFDKERNVFMPANPDLILAYGSYAAEMFRGHARIDNLVGQFRSATEKNDEDPWIFRVLQNVIPDSRDHWNLVRDSSVQELSKKEVYANRYTRYSKSLKSWLLLKLRDMQRTNRKWPNKVWYPIREYLLYTEGPYVMNHPFCLNVEDLIYNDNSRTYRDFCYPSTDDDRDSHFTLEDDHRRFNSVNNGARRIAIAKRKMLKQF